MMIFFRQVTLLNNHYSIITWY